MLHSKLGDKQAIDLQAMVKLCVISVLNKMNGHLSCATQALYKIGVYFNKS